MFQSTHPCGVRHLCGAALKTPKRFNPRTRVGCDFKIYWQSAIFVFQSTHPCGVRRMLICFWRGWRKFQSTHPCGVRQITAWGRALVVPFQSTHPCGVRQSLSKVCCKNQRFNPRTRVGCDLDPIGGYRMDAFQSTHPCGVRPMHICCTYTNTCFNPRTRVGCDKRQPVV